MSFPGPSALGRGVIVNVGDPVPEPWSAAPVVTVDQAVLDASHDGPAPAVVALHRAWAARQPVVVALAVDPAAFRSPRSYAADEIGEPWLLDPGFEPWHDRLHFLVWANTYDARGGGEPIWWWGRKALKVGATAIEPGDGSPGDVVLPDGTPAWVDGGPRGGLAPGPATGGDAVAIVHAESVEQGRLGTVPAAVAPTSELAPDQLAAVTHGSGPARVIAPAGSGKTRVLTERLRHLVVDRGYEPASVVAVAYNRKARDEMVTRTTGIGGRILTLNALGYDIVAAGLGRRPEVLELRDVRRILEPFVPRGARRLNTDPLAPYIEALSAVRLGLRDPLAVEDERGDVPGLAEAFPAFRAELARRGVIDFDEQVLLGIELLLRDGGFRRAQQARHRHLLVDEFQDLTPAHVLLVRLLAAPGFDVFGVGDDDQVIYGHAGASPRFLTEFGRYFPGADEHALEVNYRCPPPVVDAARHLLSRNQVRVPKTIRAVPPTGAAPDAPPAGAGDDAAIGRGTAPAPPAGAAVDDAISAARVPAVDGDAGPVSMSAGEQFAVHRHPPQGGAVELVDVVQGWLAEPGVAPADVAVLTRVGSLLLAPHVALVEAGIPVSSILRADVLGRTGLRAALAYLRIAAAPDVIDPADLGEVHRRPSRGLPRWIDKWLGRCRSIDDVVRASERIDDAKVSDKLADLAADLTGLAAVGRSGTTRAVLEYVRDSVGLARAVDLLDASGGGEGQSHRDDLEALLQVADLHPDPGAFEPWLRSALTRPDDAAGVALSTVHRVKGREWPRVAVFGATEGLMPHRLAQGRAAVEEERRVFHVAITRGIGRVAVFADASRPSPFLAELDRDASPDESARADAASDDSAAVAERGRGRTAKAPVPAASGPAAAGVEAALREWRRQRSKADGVPAYVVINDRHLMGIAERRPTSTRALAACPGIGPAKLAAYGDELVALVKASAPPE